MRSISRATLPPRRSHSFDDFRFNGSRANSYPTSPRHPAQPGGWVPLPNERQATPSLGVAIRTAGPDHAPRSAPSPAWTVAVAMARTGVGGGRWPNERQVTPSLGVAPPIGRGASPRRPNLGSVVRRRGCGYSTDAECWVAETGSCSARLGVGYQTNLRPTLCWVNSPLCSSPAKSVRAVSVVTLCVRA